MAFYVGVEDQQIDTFVWFGNFVVFSEDPECGALPSLSDDW